jgi:CheY-like chemotaxis protein
VSVLVVDDDASIRELLVELLEDEGYSVVSAANGEEALRYLQQQGEYPCVILLDLMMPQMNGWEFRAAQRQNPALAAIPVVTISAHVAIAPHAAELDAAAHLAKPIDIPQLIATLEHYCGRGERVGPARTTDPPPGSS